MRRNHPLKETSGTDSGRNANGTVTGHGNGNGNGRATLRDVASVAGVSVSTVSLVLSGKSAERRISAEVERRVREVAREKDYSPNLLVRSLQRGRTHVMSFYSGFSTRDPGDLYMDRITAAVERAAGVAEYDLLVHSSQRQRSPEEMYSLFNGGFSDGVLIFGPEQGNPLVALLRTSRLPVVVLGHADSQGTMSYVCDDWTDGMFQVADALVSLGHRRLGVIAGGPWSDSAVRIAALQTRLRQHGLAVPDDAILPTYENGGNSPEESVAHLLSVPPGRRPSALFCWHDWIGYRVLEACDRLGVRVPEELSLVGYDGIHWSSTSPHILASVQVPMDQMADSAVAALDQLICGTVEGPIIAKLPVTLNYGTTLTTPA